MSSKKFSAVSFEKARSFLNEEFDSNSEEKVRHRSSNPIGKTIHDFALSVLALYIEKNPPLKEKDNPNEMKQC